MRALLLLAALALLAGCAEPETGATPVVTPSVTSPPATPAMTPATPSATPTPTAPPVTLGVVLDETHDFAAGGRKMSFFNVSGAESKVVIFVDSAGPPEDRSFTSAVVDFYFPSTTSPFLGELPGQEKHSFTVEQQPHVGMWRLVYDGVGKTSVHVRVTLE